MSRKRDQIQKYSLVIFIFLSYSITWIILFPLAMVFNSLNFVVQEIWHAFGALGPSVSAIIILSIEKGTKGLGFLYNRISFKMNPKLFLLSLSPIFLLLIIVLIEWLTGIFNPIIFIKAYNLNDLFGWFIFFLPIFSFGFFEEIGWRGYLLPKLQTKYNAFHSTLILSIIWWLWHIPTFFYRFDLFFGLILMFPLLLSGSIFITHLFNQSGNLLITILFHISYNGVNTHEISLISVIAASVFIIFMSIRIIRIYGTENLANSKRIEI